MTMFGTMTMVHLVCGATGAGKTSYALKLSRQLNATLFSIDEWMMTLYGPDRPEPMDLPWMLERIERCETQMAALVLQLGSQGVRSVLDISLLREEQRRKWAALASKAGLSVQLHFIDVTAEERWRRVTQRNEQQGETYRLTVTRPMFDYIESVWQPPTPEELKARNGIRIAA
jgi:predicted kinase